MGIKKFLQAPFVINPKDLERARTTRAAARWVLDLLRNVVVVAFLFVVAEKSGKWYMNLIAWLGFCAIWAYCSSYWEAVAMNLEPFKQRWLSIVIFVALTIPLVALVMAVSLGLQLSIREIAGIQAR
jgi:hypothetical protein